MAKTLEKGERIEIRGFGTFSIRTLPARENRNPKTGEKVNTPDKQRIHFKPGLELREMVNKKYGVPEPKADS